MANLQCLPPSVEPRVSDHIDQIVNMIKQVPVPYFCGFLVFYLKYLVFRLMHFLFAVPLKILLISVVVSIGDLVTLTYSSSDRKGSSYAF